MVIDEIKNIKSGRKQLQEFGITIGMVLALIGAYFFWRGRPAFYWLLISAAIFFFLGLIWPAALKPLQKIWMSLAVVMGFFMTRLILLILFYLIITPIGFFLKVRGKDLLGLKFDKNAPSYWLPKKGNPDRTSYEKQF